MTQVQKPNDKSSPIEVVGEGPTNKRGIMEVIRREFDRDLDALNPFSKFKARIVRDEKVYETLAKGIAEKADIALTAYRDAAEAEKFQRRANIAVEKDQIYNQYVALTEESKRAAVNKLQVAARSILSESGEEFAKLEEVAFERQQRWDALLADGKMTPERHQAKVDDLYKDADKLYQKCSGAIDAHITEIVEAFIDHVRTFTPKERDTFER